MRLWALVIVWLGLLGGAGPAPAFDGRVAPEFLLFQEIPIVIGSRDSLVHGAPVQHTTNIGNEIEPPDRRPEIPAGTQDKGD